MGEIRNFKSGDAEGNGAVVRRLAAIIVADIVSYSRLMQQDEEGTHFNLSERKEIVTDF